MHTIRLTASWEREPAGGFRRRFHWVARLEEDEQVWLVFQDVQREAEVFLNDRPLGRIAPTDGVEEVSDTAASQPRLGEPRYGENRFLVTEYLESSNALVVLPSVSSAPSPELSLIVANVCLTICEEP